MNALLRPFLPAALLGCVLEPLAAQSEAFYEKPPIAYSATPANDAMTVALARRARGEIKFSGEPKAILAQLLAALGVPVESQILVFSKTSLQTDLIRPENPRALYFSDLVYVGWVPGGDFEITAFSPGIGPTFYKVSPDQLRNVLPDVTRKKEQAIVREEDCMRCHGGIFSDRVPGLMVRSVPTTDSGSTRLDLGSRVVSHKTGLERRWGGYYVTGVPDNLVHLGNAITGINAPAPATGKTVKDLSQFITPSKYLTGTSDIVALMVLEHQTTVVNALTKGDYLCRQRMAMQQALTAELGEPPTEAPNEITQGVYDSAVEEILDALLFKGEAPLPDGGLQGGDSFRDAFQKPAHHDREGRSLRDFQLLTRLFKHRCSYMIESEVFKSLYPPLRKLTLQRLHSVLEGTDPENRYVYLSESERAAIAGIVSATVPGFREISEPQSVSK